MRIQHFPESVFTISRNAYSHAPDFAVSVRTSGKSIPKGKRSRTGSTQFFCSRVEPSGVFDNFPLCSAFLAGQLIQGSLRGGPHCDQLRRV